MHSDTYKLIKRHCDGLRAQLSDVLPSSTVLTSLLNMAKAESLLAAHDAASEPLPSGWAHIHEVDNAGVTGIVTVIPGGLRVEWLDADVPDDATEPAWRIRDVHAISRVDWITKEQYMAHADMTRSMVADRAKEHYRRTHWPEGYRLVKRSTEQHPYLVYGIQRIADGWVLGFWRDCGQPLSEVWEIAESGSGAFHDLPYPVEPCADMPIPF